MQTFYSGDFGPAKSDPYQIDVEDVSEVLPNAVILNVLHDSDIAYPRAAASIARTIYRPTVKEIAEHEVTHVRYRSWCAHFVAGRGKSSPHTHHRHGDGDDKAIPTIALDYCDISSKGQEHVPPIDVRCDISKAAFCHQVQQKGNSEQWVVDRAVKDIQLLGWSNICIESDQEPAMVAIQNCG